MREHDHPELHAIRYRKKYLTEITTNTEKLLCKSGYAVAQLVEALSYKAEGRGFDSICDF